MSAPAPHGAPLNPSTDPRSGIAFRAACERRDFQSLQDVLRSMTKRDAVDHLCWLFPSHAREWMRRNLPYLMALTPADFERALHADPTANAAIRSVMRAA